MVRVIMDDATRIASPSTSGTPARKPVSLPPAPTFLSARDISLDEIGSISNGDASQSIGKLLDVDMEEAGVSSSGRRKRAAKASAMSALSASARNDDVEPPKEVQQPTVPSNMPLPSKNPARRVLPRAPPLDFSQIRTSAPAHVPSRNRARLFNLEHCPIYYPTVDEFAQPMEYIERVAKESKDGQYGICKVVPPEGWKPPFALDTEVINFSLLLSDFDSCESVLLQTFRFKTRLQRLNSMEASARANLNFLEQLYIFHRQQKNSNVSIPVIGTKPVDLWRLRKEVNVLGGYEAVSTVQRVSMERVADFQVSAATGVHQSKVDPSGKGNGLRHQSWTFDIRPAQGRFHEDHPAIRRVQSSSSSQSRDAPARSWDPNNWYACNTQRCYSECPIPGCIPYHSRTRAACIK